MVVEPRQSALNISRHAARFALLLGLALPGAWALHDVDAHFAQAEGFSGQAGPTCTACHLPPSPTNDDAKAHLDGVPAAWEPGKSYVLTVSVTGGPPALPAPQAQGGFDLSTDGGRLSGDPATPGFFRNPSSTELTYTAAGTHQRQWTVVWTAPDLARHPATAHLWLAVLAANGNHVIALNTSDQGETLDSAASLQATVPPSHAALQAWTDLPLLPPTADLAPAPDGSLRVQGRHADANATDVAWSVDGSAWQHRATGPQWALSLVGLSPGAHRLDVRSEGLGRTSPIATYPFRVAGDGQVSVASTASGPGSHAAAPASLPPLAGLLAALAAGSRRLLPPST